MCPHICIHALGKISKQLLSFFWITVLILPWDTLYTSVCIKGQWRCFLEWLGVWTLESRSLGLKNVLNTFHRCIIKQLKKISYRLNVSLCEMGTIIFTLKLLWGSNDEQAHNTLVSSLYYALQIHCFTDWRLVAILWQASPVVPFLQ